MKVVRHATAAPTLTLTDRLGRVADRGYVHQWWTADLVFHAFAPHRNGRRTAESLCGWPTSGVSQTIPLGYLIQIGRPCSTCWKPADSGESQEAP